MSYTAKDVKDLRERTGCGMMDCKNALAESNGDMEKAVEILREKGLAVAAKKAGRVAAEGMVLSIVDNNVGVIVEVNSETDFVAKNEKFVGFVEQVAKTIVKENPADVDTLLKCKIVGGDLSVEDELREKILVIGENLTIRRFERLEGDLGCYVHGGGKIGVLVQFETNVADNADFANTAKAVAMQIAAVSPLYLDRTSVPADVVEKEKEVLLTQALNEGKPKEIAEKMVMGRLQKYFKDICLLDQDFIMDSDINVAKFIEQKAKEFGGNLKLTKFVRFEKGEGLEKKEDNFADEVANMVK